MKLKKHQKRVINDLANWSFELCVMSDRTSDGFSEKDFQKWCRCVLRFLRMFPANPRDLLIKD